MSEPSDVAHYDGLEFWNPVDSWKMDRLLGFLRLRAGASVLDVGCGNAEVLLRLVRRYGVRATGIDRSPFALAKAREAFAFRAPKADVALIEKDAADWSPGENLYDAIVWVGGPFLGETFESTLQSMTEWLAPGGTLLIGHGFWMQPPPDAFVEATGIDTMHDHAGNIECGRALGLRPLYTCVSTRDEWDHFEGTIRFNMETYAEGHPDDPDPRGRLEQSREFYLAQQRWGRDTMGFGFYVFGKPAESTERA